mmetsp:Transcript_5626/g.34905  ORF Transcript_5626/g.34905 Transcript_5626/m.34905 type:complete len:272 (-) Transcript_5626:157-972(-)
MLFHIFHIIDHICFRVIDADGNDFPVEFTIINHGKHTDRFHFVDTAHLSCGASNFDNVDWIIVSCHTVSIHFCVGDVWIFPCLWYQSIVPIDVVGIEPEVPFLDVLLYGCGRFIRGDFHFGRCFFRNLTDEIQGPILIIQGDVMPRRDVLSLFVLKEHAEAGAVGFPLGFAPSTPCQNRSICPPPLLTFALICPLTLSSELYAARKTLLFPSWNVRIAFPCFLPCTMARVVPHVFPFLVAAARAKDLVGVYMARMMAFVAISNGWYAWMEP